MHSITDTPSSNVDILAFVMIITIIKKNILLSWNNNCLLNTFLQWDIF